MHRWTWLPACTDSQVNTLILQIGLVLIVLHTIGIATHRHWGTDYKRNHSLMDCVDPSDWMSTLIDSLKAIMCYRVCAEWEQSGVILPGAAFFPFFFFKAEALLFSHPPRQWSIQQHSDIMQRWFFVFFLHLRFSQKRQTRFPTVGLDRVCRYRFRSKKIFFLCYHQHFSNSCSTLIMKTTS